MECYECGSEIDEEDIEFECPFCGKDDYGEGYLRCDNCETLYDVNGDMWECPYCHNHGEIMAEKSRRYCECPSCGALMDGDDMHCEECGWPDVNQGWLGEEYGD